MDLNEQDWDLIDNDGFVCRRLKRTRLDPTTISPDPTDQSPDPAAEAKVRRERKKNTLKLKEKYQKEIDQWGLLSNALQAIQNRTQNQPFPADSPVPDQQISFLPDSTHRELADTVLAKVEAQEVFITEASRLCDLIESLCDTQKQLSKQPFFGLPIWELSPKYLMVSLLED